MKQFFTLLAAAIFATGAFAQLPNGSIAPDFTITDINGQSHNLQTYLDQGMSVVLDFSATWCGPCWGFHEEGTLKDLYNAFGPGGTGDVMVFYIESDPRQRRLTSTAQAPTPKVTGLMERHIPLLMVKLHSNSATLTRFLPSPRFTPSAHQVW